MLSRRGVEPCSGKAFYGNGEWSVKQALGPGVVEHRSFQTDVGLVDLAVAAFANGAGHLPLEGHLDLVLRRALLQALQGGKVHHHRGTHDGHVVVLEVGKGDLADVGGNHAGLKAGGGGVVQGADGMELPLEFLQLLGEEDAVDILEARDEVHRPDLVGVVIEVVEGDLYRGHAGAAADDHQILALEVVDGEGLAVGAPHEEHIPRLKAEDALSQPADLADGELHIVLPLAADRDGGLPHLGDGQLEELAVPGLITMVFHPEGVLRLGLLHHAEDFMGRRKHDVVHISAPPVLPPGHGSAR